MTGTLSPYHAALLILSVCMLAGCAARPSAAPSEAPPPPAPPPSQIDPLSAPKIRQNTLHSAVPDNASVSGLTFSVEEKDWAAIESLHGTSWTLRLRLEIREVPSATRTAVFLFAKEGEVVRLETALRQFGPGHLDFMLSAHCKPATRTFLMVVAADHLATQANLSLKWLDATGQPPDGIGNVSIGPLPLGRAAAFSDFEEAWGERSQALNVTVEDTRNRGPGPAGLQVGGELKIASKQRVNAFGFSYVDFAYFGAGAAAWTFTRDADGQTQTLDVPALPALPMAAGVAAWSAVTQDVETSARITTGASATEIISLRQVSADVDWQKLGVKSVQPAWTHSPSVSFAERAVESVFESVARSCS